MSHPTEPDLYAVLGVEPSASQETIKQAYRRKVLELHPDHNPNVSDAAARLQAATDAYGVLKDGPSRRAYDQRRRDGQGRADWTDQLLGRRRPERGADLKVRVTIDLEELVVGPTRTLSFERAETCDICNGTGARPGTTPEPCRTCGGRGSKGSWILGARCADCRGTGRRFAQSCPVCAGAGRTRVKRRLEARVPLGADSGTRLRYRGEGDAGIDGGPRGDLFVVIEVREHPLFARSGLDLVAEVPLTLSEAVLGADVDVPTLAGRVSLWVDPGTTPGREVRLPGGGLMDDRGRTGDLRVRWAVEIPGALTSAQRKLFEELRELERSAPPNTRLERVRSLIGRRVRS